MSLVDNAFGPPHREVEPAGWHAAAEDLRDEGFAYFDWLSAVDESPEGYRLVLHVAKTSPGTVEHVLLATHLDGSAPRIDSVADVWAGASWHERETHEMFGIAFTQPGSDEATSDAPLLLPDGFEGNPLRKDFVLVSRVVKAWPGAKEPGESDADSSHSPSRRRMRPPGVPEPDEWGPATDG